MTERRPLVLVGGRQKELPVGDTLPGGGGMLYRKQQVFTSSQSWTLPATALPAVEYIVQAAGASGCAVWQSTPNQTSFYLGGGGGQRIHGRANLIPNSSYTVIVGAGGASAVALFDGTAVAGNDGGNSEIVGVVTATGGTRGGHLSYIGVMPLFGSSGNGAFPSVPVTMMDSQATPPGAAGGAFRYTTGGNVHPTRGGPSSETTGPGGGSVGGTYWSLGGSGAGRAFAGSTSTSAANGSVPGAGGGACVNNGSPVTSGSGYRGQVDIIYWDTVP